MGNGKLAMNLNKKLRELRRKKLIKIDNKVDSNWLCLDTMFLMVYVIMIVKESRIQQVLNIFQKQNMLVAQLIYKNQERLRIGHLNINLFEISLKC